MTTTEALAYDTTTSLTTAHTLAMARSDIHDAVNANDTHRRRQYALSARDNAVTVLLEPASTRDEREHAEYYLADAGRPRQLRFRMNFAPADDPRTFDGTGQLVATIADAERSDNFHEIPISRANVNEDDVEAAIDGWEDWALLYEANNGLDRWISLAAIQDRINATGLGITADPPPNGE